MEVSITIYENDTVIIYNFLKSKFKNRRFSMKDLIIVIL